jgi:hypothetical protein
VGKSSKSRNDSDRQAKLEQMRAEAKASERRRTMLIVGVVVAVGLAIIGAGAYPLIKQNQKEGKALISIGASASAAKCGDYVTEKAEGNQNHVELGVQIPYTAAPPAFGPHWPDWAPMSRKFFEAGDRPELEILVHNLEHGYTILWYDETIADDSGAMSDLRAIAKKFPSSTDLNDKFLVAPWTSTDAGEFPDGMHLALSHWSMGGTHGNPDEQTGIWQYCGAVSGAAVASFLEDYPYTDSPEPGAM